MDNNRSVEFLPGFTRSMGTKPGAIIENDDYVLTFNGVLLNGMKSEIISRLSGFESCYEWTVVMNILIDSLDNMDIEGAEEIAMKDLTTWLMTYPGWGLLSRLLPRTQYVNLKERLWEIKAHWPVVENYSEEGCWNILFPDAETDLENLMPEIMINISEGDFGGEAGRKKNFYINFISSNWIFTVKFHILKRKTWSSSLVDIAAAAVARNLKSGHVDIVDKLNIPATLKSPLSKTLRDQRWMSSSKTVRRSLV